MADLQARFPQVQLQCSGKVVVDVAVLGASVDQRLLLNKRGLGLAWGWPAADANVEENTVFDQTSQVVKKPKFVR